MTLEEILNKWASPTRWWRGQVEGALRELDAAHAADRAALTCGLEAVHQTNDELRAKLEEATALVRDFERLMCWSDTMQCYVVFRNERTRPVIRRARAFLAAPSEPAHVCSGSPSVCSHGAHAPRPEPPKRRGGARHPAELARATEAPEPPRQAVHAFACAEPSVICAPDTCLRCRHDGLPPSDPIHGVTK